MKIRKHKGQLTESMATVEEIDATQEAVIKWALRSFIMTDEERALIENVTVEKYGKGIDERIGWDTYIVHVDGVGVLGFTDGPLHQEPIEDKGKELNSFIDSKQFEEFLEKNSFILTVMERRYCGGSDNTWMAILYPTALSMGDDIEDNLTGGDELGVMTEIYFEGCPWYPAAFGTSVLNAIRALMEKVIPFVGQENYGYYVHRAAGFYAKNDERIAYTGHEEGIYHLPETLADCEGSFIES